MSSNFLDFSVQLALLFLSASFLLTVFKVIKGPTLPDRVLALDMLVATAIGYIAVLGIKTGYTLYLDIAIALGLVGFLATVAFARFIMARGKSEEAPQVDEATVVVEPTLKKTTAKRATTKKLPTKKTATSARKKPATKSGSKS